jgi:SAM-dependent methyltransferase
MTLELKTTFNTATERYHAHRPNYPAALFEKLITDTKLTDSSQLLEIGPGTGQATKPLAEKGYAITAVELGDELAEKAREVLADFPNVEIITGAYEEVDLPKNHFDLVYSATAFHWIQPEVKFTKTHKLLKPGGYLALIHTEHVSDEAGDIFFHVSKPLYQKYQGANTPVRMQDDDFTPPKLKDLRPPEKIDEDLFSLESFTVFPMELSYTSQEYIDLLATYSPQLAMPEERRTAFLTGLKELIDKDFGGHMTKQYGMTLTVAKRR